jgi:hypothetical protein
MHKVLVGEGMLFVNHLGKLVSTGVEACTSDMLYTTMTKRRDGGVAGCPRFCIHNA